MVHNITVAINPKIKTPQRATNPFSLITSFTTYTTTSDVIFFPSFPIRRRFPRKVRSTSTVIHATTVVRTARTINPATTTAAAKIKGKTEAASLSPEEKIIEAVEKEIKRKNKQVVVVVVFLLKKLCSDTFMFFQCLSVPWNLQNVLGGGRRRIEGAK